MNRRSFLKTTLSSGIAAAIGTTAVAPSTASAFFLRNWRYRILIPELYRAQAKPPGHSTALVIGSGFGGAISALRLAQAGIQTTVLERGQRWPNHPTRAIFANENLPDGRGFWQKNAVSIPIVLPNGFPYAVDKFGGVLDITQYDNIDIWRGACMGGGSVVFTGVMIQPERSYFETIFGDTVSFDEMNDTYYPRVREMLNLSTMPDDIYNSMPFGHSRLWDDQSVAAGFEPERIDSIFNWEVVRDELNGLSKPSATVGMSDLGNSNGAKFDLNQNYIKQAEDTGYAQFYSNQQVLNISQVNGQYVVDVEKLNPAGKTIDAYQLTCDYLFLAAGSIGTSELLVKAKEKGSLSALNEEVGQGWGTNGDTIVVRSCNLARGLVQGSPSASKIHDDSLDIPTTFESWYVPGLPVDIGLIGTLGMGFDMENRGEFSYNASTDSVDLNWEEDGNSSVISAAEQLNQHISDSVVGSTPGFPPLAPSVNGSFTAHPLGGAVLGKATDNYGRVKNYQNLYVMDGAAIPGTTGSVNPSLTISALAERNIQNIIENDLS